MGKNTNYYFFFAYLSEFSVWLQDQIFDFPHIKLQLDLTVREVSIEFEDAGVGGEIELYISMVCF